MEEDTGTFNQQSENNEGSENVYFYVPFKSEEGIDSAPGITIKGEVIEELPVVEEVEIDTEGTAEVVSEFVDIKPKNKNEELKKEHVPDIIPENQPNSTKRNELKVILLQRIPVESNLENQVFLCQKCNCYFKSYDELLKHDATHVLENHLCYVCGKSFRKFKMYEKHMQFRCGKPFKCNNCTLRYEKENELKSHFFKTHVARRSLECPFCYRRFSRRDILKGHVVCHVGGEPFKCTLCSKSFYGSWQLKSHYKDDHEVDKHSNTKCFDCNLVFPSEKHLMAHLKNHLQPKPILCHICGKILASEEMLSTHMGTHFSNHKWHCASCPKSFNKETMLKNHMRKHFIDRPFLCNVCGKGFGSVAHLSRHSQIHSKDNVFKCTNCKKEFNQKQSLSYHLKKCNYARSLESQTCYRCGISFEQMDCSFSEHIKNHEQLDRQAKRDRKKPIKCPLCLKVVHCEKYLKLHMNSHSGLKPFPCEVCKRSFSTPGNLLRHKEIHTEVKQFLCSMCGRRFHQKQTLSNHIRSHLGIKRYQCQICDRRFSEGRSLKRHISRHEAEAESHENVYQCTGCDQKFYTEESVLEHIQTCQGED